MMSFHYKMMCILCVCSLIFYCLYMYLSLCTKETKFEYEVHQNIQEERQNQLRW